jgi:glycerol-3-phosphate O-acyltransferase
VRVVAPAEAPAPSAATASTLYLMRPDGPVDRAVLEEWAAGRPVAWDVRDATATTSGDSTLITPVRVAWLPPGEDGRRRWRTRDLPLRGLGARLPDRERRRLRARSPDRCAVVVGAPASLGELRAAAQDERTPLTALVERRAQRALDRSERTVMGAGHKVARAVPEELLASPRFVAGISRLADRLERDVEVVRGEAEEHLRALVTEQDPLARDVWARLARFLWSRAYTLDVDVERLAELRALAAHHPLVFLPSHRSNLDGFVMATLMHEHGFPPNHTLGGRNFGFWPLGALGRRVGVIWILRAGAEDPVYKFVLRSYLGHLVERRFNLEWYMEGGRSRTGKLLPPKIGLLSYLTGAVEASGVRDVHLVPVSITYDRLEEAREMTAESRGATKTAEGARWFAGYARRQTGRFGQIHVNFAEPIRLSEALEAAADGPDDRNALPKVAFEVCAQINRVTPVTANGVLTLAMLGLEGRALTASEVHERLVPILRYARQRELPGGTVLDRLEHLTGTQAALGTIVEAGVVSCYADGREPVYAIGPENELVAAFYRNGIVHWFVTRAITELALLHAAERSGDGSDPVSVAWHEALRLRDVLKFEFFFRDKETFRMETLDELALIDPGWAEPGHDPLDAVGRALMDSGALVAHRVLLSFVEAYAIVADCLACHADRDVDEAKLVAECLAVGEQQRRQGLITSGEAVSRELFGSALRLAANRRLLARDGSDDLPARREAFTEELVALARRVQLVGRLDRRAHDPAGPTWQPA